MIFEFNDSMNIYFIFITVIVHIDFIRPDNPVTIKQLHTVKMTSIFQTSKKSVNRNHKKIEMLIN